MIARLVAASLALPLVASAQPRDLVADAAAAFHDLRYDDALHLLDQAWRAGDSKPDRIRAIFALAGQAAGSIGDDEAARMWFSRWLCLEPQAELPPGTSPKLAALFASARAALAGSNLAGRASHGGGKIALSIVDPLALVDAARLGATRVPVRDGAATLPDQPGDIELVDRYGNVLATISAPIAVATETRWYERPPTWAIGAGGFAAIAGVSLGIAIDARSQVRDLNRDSAMHQFSEADALAQRFDRASLIADLAIGGTLISAAIGTVLWLRGHREAVAVTPHGAAIGWAF